MGIPEMLAQSKDSGGMEGFFNSPIAMILMPRTAARFQEARKDQLLLAQAQRKYELADQFASQIEKQDPFAAAMIRADPNAMDNVWTSMYNANKQKELAGVNFQNDLLKQQNQNDLALKLKEAESMLPGGVGAYQATMGKFLEDSVATKTQGPNMPGLPTAGEVASQNIDPKRMTLALSKDYGLPDLVPGNALRIMQDPTAAADLQDNRRADLELGKDTVVVKKPGTDTYHAMGIDPATGARTVDQGEVAPPAGITEASSKYLDMPDGYRYGFNVNTRNYDRPMGKTPPDANDPRMKTVEVFDEKDQKSYVMGWDPATNDYTRKIGIVPPKGNYSVGTDERGNLVIKYGTDGGGTRATETTIKGNSLWEASKDQFVTAAEGFDELSKFQNTTAGIMGTVGRIWRTDKGQKAADSLEQLGTNYIYALSGQQAPKQEVDNFLNRLVPLPTDGPETLKNKKALLYSAMRAIKSRTSEGLTDKDKISPSEAVSTLSGSIPPMPEEVKAKGYTQEQWESLDPSDWAKFEEDN